MLFFTLKTIVVSLLLIALIHYLYGFFKNTLTVPKVKDLVNKPAQRYNQMFAGLKRENDYTQHMIAERHVSVVPERNVGPQKAAPEQNVGPERNVVPQNMSMQAELNSFLNELKKPTTTAMPTIASSNANFSAANESAFGAYTHLFM